MAVGIMFLFFGNLFLFVLSCLQIWVNCPIWVFTWISLYSGVKSGDILLCYASDLVYLEDRSGPVIFLFYYVL